MNSRICACGLEFIHMVIEFDVSFGFSIKWNKIEMFPSNIVANMFKYSKKTMFAVDDTNQRQNVKVEF